MPQPTRWSAPASSPGASSGGASRLSDPVQGAAPPSVAEAALPPLGARVDRGKNQTRFATYATTTDRCAVRLFDAEGKPGALFPMRSLDAAQSGGAPDGQSGGAPDAQSGGAPDGQSGPCVRSARADGLPQTAAGFFTADVAGVGHGALYKFVLGDRELPDPYARFMPQGVMGPSMVVDTSYRWKNDLVTRPLSEHVIYELHVGTFSAKGTYAGVAEHLPDLVTLGITAIELMPLAAFAGARGWGYDGVALYAPFAAYGTPDELRALVDQAHGLGLAVLLDVVYNHFGPAGNFLGAYSANYFTQEIRNAWGDAPNYAHPVMRRLITDNARYWLEDFRFDGLRLDAVHAIVDPSPQHIVRELAEAAAGRSPRRLLIAEDDRNDPAWVTDIGVEAIWADDFHHEVRVTVTGERDGYYSAYQPGAAVIAETIQKGWFYDGQIYAPTGRTRGKSAEGLEAHSFVYCLQNHDQVGNRALGDRLNACVSPEQYRAVSTLLLFLPMTPLLFMGQEWAASSPFLFFIDHDPDLARAIFKGRLEEFKHFRAFAEPERRACIPNPQDPATFERSRLCWEERARGDHAQTLALYRALLALRRADPVLRVATRQTLSARAIDDVLVVSRTAGREARTLWLNFGREPRSFEDLGLAGAGTRQLFWSDGLPPEKSAGRRRRELAPATALITASAGIGDHG